VVSRVLTVPDPFARAFAALTLMGFVGFKDAGECIVGLGCQGLDDRHPPAPGAVAQSPRTSAARRQDIGCGASIMSRGSATIRSGRCTRARGVPLRPDHAALQFEQRHRWARSGSGPAHRMRLSPRQRTHETAGRPPRHGH
jgi:hypothetical protein